MRGAEGRESADHTRGGPDRQPSGPGNEPLTGLHELAVALSALGCPQHKVREMAAHLDKRARQLAEQKQRSYEEALAHLLQLMRQGWAAQEKGVSG